MATLTEQLYRAVCISLAKLPIFVGVHDRSRCAVFTREEMPCVRVMEGDDVLIEALSDMDDLRELTIDAEIYLYGQEQQQKADAIRQALVTQLWSSTDIERLSGWLRIDDRLRPETAEGDGLQLRIIQRIRLRYSCNRRSLQ